MAYSAVSKPRFYIPMTELFYYNGALTVSSDSFTDEQPIGYLNPSRTFTMGDYATDGSVGGNGNNDRVYMTWNTKLNELFGNKGFIAVLGHNMASAQAKCEILSMSTDDTVGTSDYTALTFNNVINGFPESDYMKPTSDGFSIATFDASGWADDQDRLQVRFDQHNNNAYATTPSVGCIVIGRYFDMPVNPDMKLSMVRDYSGVKKTITKSGASLSNAGYIRPAAWNSGDAWELNAQKYANARTGRRIWSLNYSFLDDYDVFSSNETVNNYVDPSAVSLYEDGDVNTANTPVLNYNIGSDPSFYASVINPSVGGHLPFIFNPVGADGTGQDNSPSNFAIARFDQKNFKLTQSMHRKFTFNTKIMESW